MPDSLLSRRALLAGLAGGAALLPAQTAPGRRSSPALCLYSKHLAKLQYFELGPVLSQLGFDGCDLSVEPDGHVRPESAPADLTRAVESLQGDGVDVPMISTALTSAADPWAATVVAIAGLVGVPLHKPGYWKLGASGIDDRLAEVRRDFAGLVALGRHYAVATAFHNLTGAYVGGAASEARAVLADLDPRWAGYCFDPSNATVGGGAGGCEDSLRLAIPRLKALTLQDFRWTKDAAGKATATPCPLGEGVVDWPGIFSLLAQARFSGPISLRLDYGPKDELAAMARDLEFARKRLAVAYGNIT